MPWPSSSSPSPSSTRASSGASFGHASLFSFLHRDLGLSTGAAYYRKTAAELVQRFPEVIDPQRDGRLCITSVVALAKVMTPENRREVLPQFFHLSKREAVAEAVALKPVEAAPQRDVVTRVAVDTAAAPAATAPGGPGTGAAPARVPREQMSCSPDVVAPPDAFHLVESPSCQPETTDDNPRRAVAPTPRDGADPIDALARPRHRLRAGEARRVAARRRPLPVDYLADALVERVAPHVARARLAFSYESTDDNEEGWEIEIVDCALNRR